MDIRFECPHCKQRIKIDESGAGLQINCPGCQAVVTIPSPAKAPQPAGPQSVAPQPGVSQSSAQQSGGAVQPVKPGARTLPRLRAEPPAEVAAPVVDSGPPVATMGKPGKGGQYRCINPNCGAVWPESKLLSQQVAGKLSTVCPKCRGAVTPVVAPPGFWARMLGRK